MIAKMRSIGSERLFPILGGFLSDPDSEFRCLVSEAIIHIDPQAGVSLLLPLLDDPEWVVRVQICGLMHDIGDKRAVQPLIHIMKTDPDPMVRNTAAYALGGIGDPIPIPALIETLDIVDGLLVDSEAIAIIEQWDEQEGSARSVLKSLSSPRQRVN